jgi:hypothetical protein
MNFQMPPEDEAWMNVYIEARNLSWWALWKTGFRPSVNWQCWRVEWVPGRALERAWEVMDSAEDDDWGV